MEKNILIPAQLLQEEADEEDPGEPPSPLPQQQEKQLSSLESTPRRVRSLVDIYEICNLAIPKFGSFEQASEHEVWVKVMEEEIKMGEKQDERTKIICHNKSASTMAENLVHHSRTKHIAIKYHFIREVEATKEIKLDYCRTKDQIEDIFTKALTRPRFEKLRATLGVTENCIKEEC